MRSFFPLKQYFYMQSVLNLVELHFHNQYYVVVFTDKEKFFDGFIFGENLDAIICDNRHKSMIFAF